MIIFIRHAEKTKDRVHLSHKGNLRANLLAEYFQHPFGEFTVPTRVIAMSQKNKDTSDRCFETVMPTCVTLLLDHAYHTKTDCFNNVIGKVEVEELMNALKNRNEHSSVLVCWEHNVIPIVVRLLGYSVNSWGLNPLYSDDDDDCYDATWVKNK